MEFAINFTSKGEDIGKEINKMVTAFKAAEVASERVNQKQQTLLKWRRQLAEANRRDRQAAFERLGPEEKLNQLYARRATLADRLARASGIELRTTALKLAAARTEAQIRQAEATKNKDAGGGGVDAGTAGVAGVLLGGGAAKALQGLEGKSAKEILKQVIAKVQDKGLRGTLGGLGGFMGKGFLRFGGPLALAIGGGMEARRAIGEAGRISDEAAMLDLDTDTYQKIEFAAKRTGAAVSDASSSMLKLQVAMARAMNGNKADIERFQRLGVSLGDLKSKRPEDIFQQIAARLKGATPDVQQVNDLIKVMGEMVSNLLPAFRQGFGELMKQAQLAGAVLDKDVIETLDRAGDTFETWGNRFKQGFSTMFSYVVAKPFNATSRFLDKTIGRSTAYIAARVSGRTPGEALKQAAEHGSAFDPAENPPKAATPTAEPEMDEQTLALRDKNKQTLRGMEWDSQSKGEQYQRLLAEESKLRERRRRETDPAAQEYLIERELEVTQKILALRGDLAELQKRSEEALKDLAFDSLTTEEKRLHLERERAGIAQQISREQDPFKQTELKLRDVQSKAQLESLEAAASAAAAKTPRPDVDSLTRIGAHITGSGSNGMVNHLKEMKALQKATVRSIEHLERTVDRLL